jgi:2-phospho-L-lactate/phosphoenolpyruvate guanylyltransferase
MDRLDSERDARRIWATVPFKGPIGTKSRLSSLLNAAERERLSLAMLDLVLRALLDTPVIEQVLLMTPPGLPRAWTAHKRLLIVEEPPSVTGTDSLNLALRRAQDTARAGEAARLLIVPGDLPFIGAGDVSILVKNARRGHIVIAPDRAETGTNALLLSPPDAIEPSFGDGSFERHRRLAAEAGLPVTVVRRPGLALDVDTPDDVSLLLAGPQRNRLDDILAELGAAHRLQQLAAAQARNTTI